MTAAATRAVARRAGVALLSIAIAIAVLFWLWAQSLHWFHVTRYAGKTPGDVWDYLFTDAPPRGVRPTSVTAAAARSEAFGALWTTLWHTLLGFVLGLAVALAIASLFVLFKPFEFAFLPIAILLRSVPLVAVAPILLLVLGRGTVSVLAVVAVVVLFPALVNLVLGMRQASPQALDLIRVNGGSEFTALRKVRVPAALPNVFAAVRISLPGSVVGAMLGEWLNGSHTGLGGIFAYYKGKQDMTGPWVVVAISVILSLLLYAAGTVIEAVAMNRRA